MAPQEILHVRVLLLCCGLTDFSRDTVPIVRGRGHATPDYSANPTPLIVFFDLVFLESFDIIIIILFINNYAYL